MEWGFFFEGFEVIGVGEVDDVFERNICFFYVGNVEGLVVVSVIEGDIIVFDFNELFVFEFWWSVFFDKFVYVGDDFDEVFLYLLGSKFEFFDEFVNFVDEENWFDVFFEGLFENGFGLGYDIFNGVDNYNCIVYGMYGFGNVIIKVDVIWSVNEVDEVVVVFVVVNY